MKNALGCTTVGYLNHPLRRALQGIADAGLEYVELGAIPGYCEHVSPALLEDGGLEGLVSTLNSYGLTPVSLSGHCDLTSREGLEYLKKCVELASELGAAVVNTGTGQTDTRAKEERFFAHASELAEAAEELGVIVALETQNLLMNSGESAKEVIEQVDSPHVRINFDPANVIYWEGRRPEEEIGGLAPYVVHMHVKDKKGGRGEYCFPPVGQGEIDFRVLFRALDTAGYEGPLMLEPELSREFDRDADEVADALHDPSTAYSRPHGYLGVDDPALVDSELIRSLAFVKDLLSTA